MGFVYYQLIIISNMGALDVVIRQIYIHAYMIRYRFAAVLGQVSGYRSNSIFYLLLL